MTSAYGSDQYGLICGYLFLPGEGGRPIGLSQAVEWIGHAADGKWPGSAAEHTMPKVGSTQHFRP